MDLEQEVRNGSDVEWRGAEYVRIKRRSVEVERSMFDVDSYSFVGPIVYNGDKSEKLKRDDLIERLPVPRDVNADTVIDGSDYVETVLTEQVSRFRIERVDDPGLRRQLVDITLELTHPDTGAIYSLQTRVRLGAAL